MRAEGRVQQVSGLESGDVRVERRSDRVGRKSSEIVDSLHFSDYLNHLGGELQP